MSISVEVEPTFAECNLYFFIMSCISFVKPFLILEKNRRIRRWCIRLYIKSLWMICANV